MLLRKIPLGSDTRSPMNVAGLCIPSHTRSPSSDKMLLMIGHDSTFGQPGRYRNTTHFHSHKHNRASLPLTVSLKGYPGHHRQVADDTIHDTYKWE
jgi:hypothetical protein